MSRRTAFAESDKLPERDEQAERRLPLVDLDTYGVHQGPETKDPPLPRQVSFRMDASAGVPASHSLSG